MKVIKSLENKGILIKGTAREIINQEGKIFNFFRPLMPACLPLLKSALSKCCDFVRIVSRNVSSRCSYSKENLWIKSFFRLSFVCNSINNF